MELDLDLEIAALNEKAGSSGGGGGRSDVDGGDPGDRLLASRGRIAGAAELSASLHALRLAALESGWDQSGGPPEAAFGPPEFGEGAAGREAALKTAVADARVAFPGACHERMAAQAYPCPAGAVTVAPLGGGSGALATVRYLAPGSNSNAEAELAAAMRAGGYGVRP